MLQEEEPRRWGYATNQRAAAFGFSALFVINEPTFCRNCEHTIPEGEPFKPGRNGVYCCVCLGAEGWEVQPDDPPPPPGPLGR